MTSMGNASLVRAVLVFRRVAQVTVGVACVLALASPSWAQVHWVTSWAASAQGPYPAGNATLQPDLSDAFPLPDVGARDQSFRLIVHPDVWGPRMRVRVSNAFGTRPLVVDEVYVGLQQSGSAVTRGTNVPVRFGGGARVTVPPGAEVWSDAAALPFVRADNAPMLAGRKLAVSLHVVGESGPMTWHAKALTTSYVTMPGAGSRGSDEGERAFPIGTTSWYFVDALDMEMPGTTHTLVAFGDSITDGTASTLNGDDRWPDVLSRRLHAVAGDRIAVVNAGIGGNRVAGPAEYSAAKPFAGGPAAGARLERDVLSLSGVTQVVWLEGINDFGTAANTTVDVVQQSMREIVGRLHAKGIRVYGATLTSAVGNGTPADSAARETRRQALNSFIRTSGVFDGVFDFDRATTDPATGRMRAPFVPNSTDGGKGDYLHPNRLGYGAMGDAVDLDVLLKP